MPKAQVATAIPAERDQEQQTNVFRYCVALVAAPLAALLLVLVIASTPWFLTHDNDPGMRTFGYSLRLKHADCDVVLYGDSTALSGLDPDIVQRITGLKSCNIAEAGWIQDVVGTDYPLKAYLKNNKRPRFIVTDITPSLFAPSRPPFEQYRFNGVLYELQYHRTLQVYLGLLERPTWLVDFDLWAGHAMIVHFMNHDFPGHPKMPPIDEWINARAQRHGLWVIPRPDETDCTRTKLHLGSEGFSRYAGSVAKMRKDYGVNGTQVIVDIMPVPACDTLIDTYRKLSQGLHDNAFEVVPISFFSEGDVHPSEKGATYISTEIGHQILALEAKEKNQQPQPNLHGTSAQ